MNLPKLWIVGCSIAHGIGVNVGERWGDIVGHKLQIDPTFLTMPASSIEWAADQILQADIGSNDIVLWGLTSPNRFLWYNEKGNAEHILNVYYQDRPGFQNTIDKHQLIQLNLAYKAVNYVKQVQNYLNKIKCQYAVGYTIPGLDEHERILADNLTNTSNFFIAYNSQLITKKVDPISFLSLSRPAYNLFVDVGSDGFHPGVQQHQLYAEQFMKYII